MKSSIESVVAYPLDNGGHTLIDSADIPLLAGRSWRWVVCGSGKKYVAAHDCANGKSKRIYLHRLILGLAGGKGGPVGDHLNGDGLNNTRANLRVATIGQNAQNCVARRPGMYRGVFRQGKNWVARLGGRYYGCFALPDHAAIAYDAGARALCGPQARVNFEASNDANY